MTNQEQRLLTAPLGGALAGAIGAGVASRSSGAPILKGALAAGLVDGVLTAVFVKIMAPDADALRWGSVAAMVGTSVGATGAAVGEADSSVVAGAVAGGIVAFLWNAAMVTAENTIRETKLLQAQNNSALSGVPRTRSMVPRFP